MKKITLILFALISVIAADAQQSRLPIAELTTMRSEDSFATIFAPNLDSKRDLKVGAFSKADEFEVRRGIPNFMARCNSGKEVRIGYIGGSITASDYQWRKQSADYIASMFPKCQMICINSGRGGSGADIGACRMEDHLMKYSPDLVFIEFAVNAANEHGVEGIIRKIIKHDPTIDICLVYTIYRGQAVNYADGEIPFNVARLEKVAKYYNLPSIHMGMQAGLLERDGKLLWEGTLEQAGDRILFSKDGVHPAEIGGDLYASAVARCFEKMKSNKKKKKLELIAPLSSRQMDRAKFLEPSVFGLKDWKVSKVTAENKYKNCVMWMDNIYTATALSTPLKFKFKGDYFGIIDTASPDTGDIDIFIDGKKWIVTDYNRGRYGKGNSVRKAGFFDKEDARPSINRFFAQSFEVRDRDIITIVLEEGVHEIEVRVNPVAINKAERLGMTYEEFRAQGDKYDGQHFNLGKILINGEIVD